MRSLSANSVGFTELFDESLTLIHVHLFFYKQSIFDSRSENCLSFSKNSPQKIV